MQFLNDGVQTVTVLLYGYLLHLYLMSKLVYMLVMSTYLNMFGCYFK